MADSTDSQQTNEKKRTREDNSDDVDAVAQQFDLAAAPDSAQAAVGAAEVVSSQEPTAKRPRPSRKVKLNVGGKIFVTLLDTLLSEPDTYFTVLFSGNFDATETADEVFIDRDPRYFDLVINHLRKHVMPLVHEMSVGERKAFLAEVYFYSVSSLKPLVAATVPSQEFIDWDLDTRNVDSDSLSFVRDQETGGMTVTLLKEPKHGAALVFANASLPQRGVHTWNVRINHSSNSAQESHVGFGVCNDEPLSISSLPYAAFAHQAIVNGRTNHGLYCSMLEAPYFLLFDPHDIQSREAATLFPGEYEQPRDVIPAGTDVTITLDCEGQMLTIRSNDMVHIEYSVEVTSNSAQYPVFLLRDVGSSFTLLRTGGSVPPDETQEEGQEQQ